MVVGTFQGEAQAGNQWVAPSNRYYARSVAVPKRNVERAKQLLKEAGVTNPSFTLMTPNFVPEPYDGPLPRLGVAAVGPVMLKVAAEESDDDHQRAWGDLVPRLRRSVAPYAGD